MNNNNSLVFFIDDKLGGVSSLNYNLIKKIPEGVRPLVIHTDNVQDTMTRAGIDYPGCDQLYFKTDHFEHRMLALKRLHSMVPQQVGALVLNYGTEMTMLDHFPVKQTTYQLIHDNYNLNLAKKYGHVVDVFICHNTYIQEQLHQIFPNRKNDVYYLPHGIEIPKKTRKSGEANKPLRLLFLGRMNPSKGIFDLPVIDDMLQKNGVKVEWGCVGSGPELEALKKIWQPDYVSYFSPETNAEVMDLIVGYDVFVLPTKFEGSPVSLLETMGTGLVPVISKLPGGIMDVVDSNIGFTPDVDDNSSFAQAIIKLNNDRELLEKLSVNCRNRIEEKFNLSETAKRYHDLFSKFSELYKVKHLHKKRTGFRLDHPLIPASLTGFIRKKLLR
jgi:glycosyltransferase involved in cell wall biosynthesis